MVIKTKQQNKEKQLLDLLDKYKLFPQRFLLITKSNRIIYSSASKKLNKVSYSISNYNIFKTSGTFNDRGRVFDDILKLEFLITQIIVVKLSNKNIDFFNYKETERWNKFVDRITFINKIQFLYDFGLIKKNSKKTLDKIRKLRNQAAHSLNDKYLEYDSSISDRNKQFSIFRKDIEKIWDELTNIYKKIWNSDEMIKYTINLIQKKYAKNKQTAK